MSAFFHLKGTPLHFETQNLLAFAKNLDLSVSQGAWRKLRSRFSSGEIGFFDLPVQESLSHIEKTLQLADKFKKRSEIKDYLILGIGGSYLGPLSVRNALSHLEDPKRQLHFLDNPDPEIWRRTLAKLRPETTVLVVITKSGKTFETLAQLMAGLGWLGPKRWKDHVVAITDPKSGDLRQWVESAGIASLPIEPSIGGRFSVFSAVGLFPMALSSLDVHAFMDGAKSVRAACETTGESQNLWFQICQALVELKSSYPAHVMMPYGSVLSEFSAWWVQLWGESLGKDRLGFTPVRALGATDQHSLLQLLRDGPNDKITQFIEIEKWPKDVSIPLPSEAFKNYAQFDLLKGQSFGSLLAIELRGVEKVFKKNGRPCYCVKMEGLDPKNLGALYFWQCMVTALTGTLLGVDPFDQPGVEESKIYIRDSLMASHN